MRMKSRLLMKNQMHSFHKKNLKIPPKTPSLKMNQLKTPHLLNKLSKSSLNTTRNLKKKRMRMKTTMDKFPYSLLTSILEKDNLIELFFMMGINQQNLQTILLSNIN